MAQKKNASKAKSPAASNVTRVRATDSAPASKKKTEKPEKKAKTTVTAVVADIPSTEKATKKRKLKPGDALKPIKATGGYFKGAWTELKQVRWPTRRATWSLTGAVLLYTAFFVVLVLLLDAGFKYLFELILGK